MEIHRCRGALDRPAQYTRQTILLAWLFSFLLLASPVLGKSEGGEKSAADYYVPSLPGQPEGPLLKMHAGLVEVDEESNGNMFFWHFQNRHIANRQRTVVWLNGGPGCSSLDGALMEVGPYRVAENLTLQYNNGSWDEFANLLFVDNPVGTGFSTVNTNSYLHELDEMTEQFIVFLEKFFDLFPEYEQDDLYFAGESYAGQYIPYIAKGILERNKNLPTGKVLAGRKKYSWNLKGLLMGNAWIAPVDQYQAYLSFAYKNGLVSAGSETAKRVEAQLSICISELGIESDKGKISIRACEEVLEGILKETTHDDQCINMYDIRLTDKPGSCGMNWPPDLANLEPYLRQTNVTEALNVSPGTQKGWTECAGGVGRSFKARNSTASIHLVPELLEAGVPIVLFSGDQDLICNHIGTEEMIHNMKWSGGTGFELSPGVWGPRHDWMFEDEPAGFYQEARNLTYILFYNSSHMVPFDYSRRSRDMLDQFMGVNLTDIGGLPADSRIDGTKTNPTTVGGHPNSTTAENEEKEKLKDATRNAYYRSGEVALVIVIIAAGVWGFFIWRSRRRQQRHGYRGVYPNDEETNGGSVMSRFRSKHGTNDDLGASDFDEAELDNLAGSSDRSSSDDREQNHYAIGDESEDEGENNQPPRPEPKSILKNKSENTEGHLV